MSDNLDQTPEQGQHTGGGSTLHQAARSLVNRWEARDESDGNEQGSGEEVTESAAAAEPSAPAREDDGLLLEGEELDATPSESGEPDDQPGGEPAGPWEFEALRSTLAEQGVNLEEVQVSSVNGPTTLREALDGGLREADYGRKMGELAEERKAFAAQREEAVKKLDETVQTAAAQAKVLDRFFEAQQQAVTEQLTPADLVRLQAEDPTQASNLYIQQRQQLDQIAAARQALAQDFEKTLTEAKAQQAKLLEERHTADRERMRNLNPEWSDDGKLTAAKTAVEGYVKERFPWTTDDELAQLSDARILIAMHESRLYREALQRRADAREKLKNGTVPTPTLQPGRQLSVGQQAGLQKGRTLQKLQQRAKASGKLNDAAKVLSERWK